MITIEITCDRCQALVDERIVLPPLSGAMDFLADHFGTGTGMMTGPPGRFAHQVLCGACMDVAVKGGWEALRLREEAPP